MNTELEPISLSESKRLIELETTIHQNEGAMLKIADALTEIRDSRLYRAEFKTFKAYCEEKLSISRSYGYRLINFSEISKMSPAGDTPKTERAARAMREASKPISSGAIRHDGGATGSSASPDATAGTNVPASAPVEPAAIPPAAALNGIDMSKLKPAVELSPAAQALLELAEITRGDMEKIIDCITGNSCDLDTLGAVLKSLGRASKAIVGYQMEIKGRK